VTSKEQQLQNSIIYLMPMIVGNLLPVITLSIFTRVLSTEDFGTWALANVYAMFVSGIANFGLPLSYERNFFECRTKADQANLLYSTLVFVSSAFVVCGVFTWMFRAQLSRWVIGSAEHAALLFWSFCAAAVMSVKVYYLTYFRNTANARAYVWYTVDESVLGAVTSLFLVGYLRIGVMGLVLGQLFASLVVLTLLAARFVKMLPVSFSGSVLIAALKLSYPLTPRLFLGVVANHFDKYMIGLLASVGGVGVYSIGQRIARVVFGYMTALENVWAPQVYQRMFSADERGGEAVGRYLTPFAYSSIAVAVVVSLAAEEVVALVSPASYHGAIAIVNILSMYYGIMFFGKMPQLMYAKKAHLISVTTLIGITANVVLNVLFIRAWGAVGAAWGTLLAGVLSVSVSSAIGQRYCRIEWEYGKLAAIFGLLAGASITMTALPSLALDYPARLGVKIAFVIGYVVLGVRLDVISRANYNLARSVFLRNLGFQRA